MSDDDFERLQEIVRLRHFAAAGCMVNLLRAISDILSYEKSTQIDKWVKEGASLTLSLTTSGHVPGCQLEIVLDDGRRILIHQLRGIHDKPHEPTRKSP